MFTQYFKRAIFISILLMGPMVESGAETIDDLGDNRSAVMNGVEYERAKKEAMEAISSTLLPENNLKFREFGPVVHGILSLEEPHIVANFMCGKVDYLTLNGKEVKNAAFFVRFEVSPDKKIVGIVDDDILTPAKTLCESIVILE